ncbi:SbcC/MukB-like Walker B domain-containing protein, partial [Streptacidiphilus anmyonensis]|uniref:SbcC/MukB-like Walker B domain-containing protein n=1 Tax=Streptacidiphilus anmyonensis TaxID=405782 RepID=UPI0005AB0A93
AERALLEAHAAERGASARVADLARLGARLAADLRRLRPFAADLATATELSQLVAGTSKSNELRMSLENYVLAARLEQVAAAAGTRLRIMSGGRYTLEHTDARARGNARSGLGLQVLDAWTGQYRDTATLSGGESFFASLALALGLADVVTDEAGGMPLDTLFIDEGFGALDPDTLEEVMSVLDSLRERDRAVGIVSHVAELRDRIPQQLTVRKGRSGSRLSQGV